MFGFRISAGYVTIFLGKRVRKKAVIEFTRHTCLNYREYFIALISSPRRMCEFLPAFVRQFDNESDLTPVHVKADHGAVAVPSGDELVGAVSLQNPLYFGF